MPHEILSPFFWASFRARTREQRTWCYPDGPTEVRVAGCDPARILVIGDSAAAGCGVLLHELGLAGHLARHVAEHTDRGVVVTVAAGPAASARSTLARLHSLDLGSYDVIVLMLATTDALCLTPRRSWRRSMTALVEALASVDTASVFVTSAASMHLARSLSPFARRLTGRHTRLLNRETYRICRDAGTPMVFLDAANDLNPLTYARWGRRLGDRTSDDLRGPTSGRLRVRRVKPRSNRQRREYGQGMNADDRMRVAAGETDALPPAPPSEAETVRKDRSYSPASESETEEKQNTEGLPETVDDDIDPEQVHVTPGTGGPDDVGDIDVDPGDLHLPGRD